MIMIKAILPIRPSRVIIQRKDGSEEQVIISGELVSADAYMTLDSGLSVHDTIKRLDVIVADIGQAVAQLTSRADRIDQLLEKLNLNQLAEI